MGMLEELEPLLEVEEAEVEEAKAEEDEDKVDNEVEATAEADDDDEPLLDDATDDAADDEDVELSVCLEVHANVVASDSSNAMVGFILMGSSACRLVGGGIIDAG